jgi:hypothetical protein
LTALTFFALVGIVVPAHAQSVVFNSFGSGNTYNTATVWGISGASVSGGYRGQAEFFTPTVSGYLSSVLLATYHVSGSTLSNFYIAVDTTNGVPGTILESFLSVVNPTGLLTLTSATRPFLQAGTEYWLCDEPATPTSYNGWYYNNQGHAPGFAFDRATGAWSAVTNSAPASGVFRITVTATPEPSALTLAATGLVALFILRRKRLVDRAA